MLSSLGNPRQLAAQLLNFGLILSTAFMVSARLLFPSGSRPNAPAKQMWKGLSVISDSPSPIVVVLSGSMEPAFQRGDLLMSAAPTTVPLRHELRRDTGFGTVT